MGNKNWSYKDVVSNLAQFKKLCANDNLSERHAAKEVGVPRTTLREWDKRTGSKLIPESIQAALETEGGLNFFHTLLTIIHFASTQLAKTGTRLAEFIFEMSGLSSLISSSYGSLHGRGVLMENYINEFGAAEESRLAVDMPHKNISIAKDETFNKNRPCLVGIDPVSNFIITETYTEKRTAEDWATALDKSLSGLNVTVIQNVNDSGSAIKKYNDTHHSKANESQDLFHILNSSNQSIVGPLSSKQRSCEKNIELLSQKIEAKSAKTKRIAASDLKIKHKKDRVGKLEAEISKLQVKRLSEEKKLQKIGEWKKRNSTANKNISALYHPYNLNTGGIRTVEELQVGLERQYDEIKLLAIEMSLSEKAISRIRRAANHTTSMLTTMRFYFNTVEELIETHDVSAPIEKLLKEALIPIAYLKMASQKKQVAIDRHVIMNVAIRLEEKLKEDSSWKTMGTEEQERLQTLSLECAQVFQRSSSCVEGRNGHLALWHHGVGSVSPRKALSKMVVSNYFVERPNGTTAAERFFGKKPKNLLRYLLEKMPLPSRSRKLNSNQTDALAMAA